MASTLQRSSVSFRRQGSSGRIWGEPLNAWELRGHSGVLSISSFPPPPPRPHAQHSDDVPAASRVAERAGAAAPAAGEEKSANRGFNCFAVCMKGSSSS